MLHVFRLPCIYGALEPYPVEATDSLSDVLTVPGASLSSDVTSRERISSISTCLEVINAEFSELLVWTRAPFGGDDDLVAHGADGEPDFAQRNALIGADHHIVALVALEPLHLNRDGVGTGGHRRESEVPGFIGFHVAQVGGGIAA